MSIDSNIEVSGQSDMPSPFATMETTAPAVVQETPEVEVSTPTEAPQEMEAPVVEETPVVVPEATVAPSRYHVGRVDGVSHNLRRSIGNPALQFFTNDVSNIDSSKHSISEFITVPGVAIRRTGFPGIWSESWEAHRECGCMFFANEDLGPVEPKFVNKKNDRNARSGFLVELKEKQYVIFGYKGLSGEFVAIYEVLQCLPANVPVVGDESPALKDKCNRFHTRLAWWYNYNPADPTAKPELYHWDDQTGELHFMYPEDDSAEIVGHIVSQALLYMNDRDKYKGAMYIQDYTECLFSKDEHARYLTDPEFLGRIVTYNSLEEAYTSVTKDIRDGYAKEYGYNCKPHLTVSVSYFPEANRIYAYLFGTIFDLDQKSSMGKRLSYGRVRINENDTFYYPDRHRTKPQDFETLRQTLKEAGNVVATKFLLTSDWD